MVYSHVVAKNRKQAMREARKIRGAVYNDKFTITDVIYLKGSKRDTYAGKGLKKYGIIFRKKKVRRKR